MIAVLASPGVWADVQAVAGKRRCTWAREQGELLQLAGDAHAVVLEAPDLPPVLDIAGDINRHHPLLPVVLITEQDSDGLQSLATVSVEAVLFPHQIAARLPAALRSSARMAYGLRALEEQYRRNESIPAPLRHLLSCALTSVPPPRTVQQLAHLMKSDPSTIRRHWRRNVNSQGIQRVKDLLDWIALLHASSAKRSSPTWKSVAKRVGTPEATLRRIAVRLTGDTLRSLGSVGAERLLEGFAASLEQSFCARLQ